MKKLAIFVEGQVELLFLEKLLTEIVGKKNLRIEIESAQGGGQAGPRAITQIRAVSTAEETRYFVLIRDCGGHKRVKSDILDACEGLTQNDFEKAIGLHDVYPITNVEKLRSGLSSDLPSDCLPIQICLAVMELEAWFLAEVSHFPKVDHRLTLEFISDQLQINLTPEQIETRPHPSDDLARIYKLVGKSYRKKSERVKRTLNLLDYVSLYIDLSARIEHLGLFIQELDAFFDSDRSSR